MRSDYDDVSWSVTMKTCNCLVFSQYCHSVSLTNVDGVLRAWWFLIRIQLNGPHNSGLTPDRNWNSCVSDRDV